MADLGYPAKKQTQTCLNVSSKIFLQLGQGIIVPCLKKKNCSAAKHNEPSFLGSHELAMKYPESSRINPRLDDSLTHWGDIAWDFVPLQR